MRLAGLLLMVALAAICMVPGVVEAVPVFAGPVPVDRYITTDGLDWAWASAASNGCCGALLEIDAPGGGWRVATEEEFANRPEVSDFGSSDDFRCAAGWFTSLDHCNYSDAETGYLTRDTTPNAGLGVNGQSCEAQPCEIWVVRGELQDDGSDDGSTGVPAPASLALLALGVVGAAPMIRRRLRR